MESYHQVLSAAHEIARAKSTVALTGAGISEESGIPTFRGRGGFWERYNPDEVGSAESFLKNPSHFWRFARDAGPSILSAKPNPAHEALAELERMGLMQGIITQNVDGLHQKAGSKKVIELHGSVERIICLNCGIKFQTRKILPKLMSEDIPRCDKCRGLLKPDIILLGEPLAENALMESKRLVEKCKVLLLVGTSLEVYPAAELPIMAARRGAVIINVNAEPSEADEYARYRLHGRAAEILPRIVHAIKLAA